MQQWISLFLIIILSTTSIPAYTALNDSTSDVVSPDERNVATARARENPQNKDSTRFNINHKQLQNLFKTPDSTVKTDFDTTVNVLKDTSNVKKETEQDSVKLTTDSDSSETIFESVEPDSLFKFETINTEKNDSSEIDYSLYPPSVTINENNTYTRSTEVKLSVNAPYAINMKLSNEKEFTNVNWQEVESSVDWKLPYSEEKVKIYLQVRYPDSTISNVVSDDIYINVVPPTPSFTITPDSGFSGETEFIVDASESKHAFELFFRWDWDDDGRYDTNWSLGRKESHIYTEGGGTKTVTLQIKDSGGWQIKTSKDIEVYSRPKAHFKFIQEYENPYLFKFDATASSDFEDGNQVLIRWNFNEGKLWDTEWSYNKTITHKFNENFDSVNVKMEVMDSHGITNLFSHKIDNDFFNMVYIPTGPFKMGHFDFDIDEKPVHEILVDGFWIDKYPVTNKQYAEFLNKQKNENIEEYIDLINEECKIYLVDSTYRVEEEYENHPVVLVTWYGANAYATFYGKGLPTEAEWEKVARGTDGRVYPWGNEISNKRTNYWDSGDLFDNHTTPVGFFNGKNNQTIDSPSPYGVYDMVGNVREWCSDWYLRNYYSISPRENPEGPEKGEKKVVRGGGYLFHVDKLRATFRDSYEPGTSNIYTGFRCVRKQ